MSVIVIKYTILTTNYPGTNPGDVFNLTVTTDGFSGICTVANGHLISVAGSLEGSAYDITLTTGYPAAPTFDSTTNGLTGETLGLGGGLFTGDFTYNPTSFTITDEGEGATGFVTVPAVGEFCRLQIYDDGAGEYLFSAPFNSQLLAGSESTNTVLAGGAFGPFVLPSPLAVTKPGLMTVSISNVNPPLNMGFATPNPTTAYVGLIFAIPKKCKGQVPSIFKQQGRRGVLS